MFWDAVNLSSKRFYLFGKRYFEDKMLVITLFKSNGFYNIAYCDEIHEENSDLVSITAKDFEQYFEKLLELDRKCEVAHENGKKEFEKTLQKFLNYK